MDVYALACPFLSHFLTFLPPRWHVSFSVERDGGKYVVYGHTYNLEVDHKRALMNGGDNSLDNLATLCRDCHVVKTKMDNSLRRKRASWSPYSFNPKAPPESAMTVIDSRN